MPSKLEILNRRKSKFPLLGRHFRVSTRRSLRGTVNDPGYYNHHHRHSGIGLYTPAAVHDGSWRDQHCARQATLDAAWRDRPDRFPRGRPKAPIVPAKAWINQPPSSIQTSTASHTSEAA